MISVVIPTKNSQRTLSSCLQSLRSQIHLDFEVIIVDNFSSDETQRVGLDFGARVFQCGPERNAQRNFGLNHALGEIVVFIDSDMVLEPLVLTDIEKEMSEATEFDICVIPEASFGSGRWGRAKVFEKSLVLGNSQVEAARAFRTKILIDMGGWDESRIAAEDWELTDRAIQFGGATCRIKSFVWHNEGSPTLQELFRKKRYYGHDAFQYIRNNPARRSGLTNRFLNRRVAGQLVRNPVSTSLLLLTKMTELFGVAVGAVLSKRNPELVYSPVEGGR